MAEDNSTQQLHYFYTSPSLPNYVNSHIQNIHQKIVNKIKQGKVKIYQNPQKFKNKINQQQKFNERLEQLRRIKQSTKQKLKEIESNEQQIRIARNRIRSHSVRGKPQKSTITLQQKEKIRQLKKSQIKFENEIKSKIRNVYKKIEEKRKQQQHQKQFQNDIKRKERVVKITKKRYQTEQSRKKQKQVDILNKKKFSNRIKHFHDYIYVKKQLEDLKKQKEVKKYVQNVLQEKKQKMKIDFQSLKRHSKQYPKLIALKKQQKLFQLQEEKFKKRAKTITYESNVFAKKLLQEEIQQKKQILQKINIKREMKQKMLNFKEYVYEKFKPKITSQSKFIPRIETQIIQSLSNHQRRAKGNQYMQIAKQKRQRSRARTVAQNQSSQGFGSTENILTQNLKSSFSSKYPNYLLQLHQSHKFRQSNALSNVLKQSKLSINKAQEAVRFIQKKQSSHNIGLNKNTANSELGIALDKISLLKSLYQSS